MPGGQSGPVVCSPVASFDMHAVCLQMLLTPHMFDALPYESPLLVCKVVTD